MVAKRKTKVRVRKSKSCMVTPFPHMVSSYCSRVKIKVVSRRERRASRKCQDKLGMAACRYEPLYSIIQYSILIYSSPARRPHSRHPYQAGSEIIDPLGDGWRPSANEDSKVLHPVRHGHQLVVAPEPVADVAYRLDTVGFVKLASEPSDVHIHRPVATIVIVAPNTVE